MVGAKLVETKKESLARLHVLTLADDGSPTPDKNVSHTLFYAIRYAKRSSWHTNNKTNTQKVIH